MSCVPSPPGDLVHQRPPMHMEPPLASSTLTMVRPFAREAKGGVPSPLQCRVAAAAAGERHDEHEADDEGQHVA